MDDSSGVPTKSIIKKYDEIKGNFFIGFLNDFFGLPRSPTRPSVLEFLDFTFTDVQVTITARKLLVSAAAPFSSSFEEAQRKRLHRQRRRLRVLQHAPRQSDTFAICLLGLANPISITIAELLCLRWHGDEERLQRPRQPPPR